MREGSRDRSQIRVGVSGTDASIVAEGPLGGHKAGSWLVSARKSYLELLLKQINEDDDDFGFGFSDVQSKLVYDVVERASSRAQRRRRPLATGSGHRADDQNTVGDGRNRATLVNAGWRFTASPSFVVTQRVAVGDAEVHEHQRDGLRAGRGHGTRPHVARRLQRDGTDVAHLRRRSAGAAAAPGRLFERQLGPVGASLLVKSHDDDAQLSSVT